MPLDPRPFGEFLRRRCPGIRRRKDTPGHARIHQGVPIVLVKVDGDRPHVLLGLCELGVEGLLPGLQVESVVCHGIEDGDKRPPTIAELLVGLRLGRMAGFA